MTLSRRQFLTSITGLTLFTSLPATTLGASPPSGRFGLVGRVVTGNDTSPLDDHAVLIDNGRVEAIVPATTVADRRIIAPPNATILPGIINAHCHQIHSPTDRADRWLKHGVTSIGDCASPLSAIPNLAKNPAGKTATAAFSGPMLTPQDGYPLPVHSADHALIVRSPRDARNTVQRLAGLGAGMIKIAFEPGPLPIQWPWFDPATAEAICNEARRLGMIVRCHVEDLSGLEPALNAGVHTIEHVPHRWNVVSEIRSVFQKNTTKNELDPYYRSLLERMVRDDIILTPTLDVLSRSAWNGPALYEPVRAFSAMGGRIAVGNDFPFRRTEAGMPLREMYLLSKAGLSNGSILQAATATSAKACGLTDRGVLAPGKTADLLVVTGNPEDNLEVLNAPLHIMKDGVFIT